MNDLNDYDELTWVATIVRAYGIKGAVKAKYFSDVPEYYLNAKLFFLETAGQLQPLNVKHIRPAKNGWIILFEGFYSRNDAEKLKGCRLLLPDDQLKPLESNEVFIHQIIGCSVEDKKGRILGRISDFLETAANNVFEVQNGTSNFMVPDVPHVVLELDLEAQQMIIDPLPGMIEEVDQGSDVAL